MGVSKTEELREKIAKLGQFKFGYVDWEDETTDAIRHWHECADMILKLCKDAGLVFVNEKYLTTIKFYFRDTKEIEL